VEAIPHRIFVVYGGVLQGYVSIGDDFKQAYCKQPFPAGFDIKPISLNEIVNEHGEELIKHDTALGKAILICQKI